MLNYFPTPIQAFQYFDKYARYDWSKGRRETWPETVERAVSFMYELAGDRLPPVIYDNIRKGILEFKVIPSMRLLAMAGPAARRTNVTLYNCSFMGVNNLDCFGEALYISMSGCGVGFSVEKKHVDLLPELPKHRIIMVGDTYKVEDSTEGWKAAIDTLFYNFFEGGYTTHFDYSNIRPTGSPLKTKGGRASGPEMLKEAIGFISNLLVDARLHHRKLTPLHVHDIMCALGQAAVSGGTRRTAMISIFDNDNEEMLRAKSGNYNNYRWNANNSAVWTHGLTQVEFMKQMGLLFGEENGEPCFFARDNARASAPARRESQLIEGLNPCGEIALRDMQFCNLSAAVARDDDDLDTLAEKVELAAVVGTIQSMATYFPHMREGWKKNCEEERLLGVDITGQMDCALLNSDDGRTREALREIVIKTNAKYADLLGINRSAATTCVKPSGNSSQLLNCSSGMHPRWSKYYIRNVRVSATSPVFRTLVASGVRFVPENGQTFENMTTAVIGFPMKSPEGAIVQSDLTLYDKLDYWMLNKKHYTEHNPSVTITYRPDEVLTLVNWLWDNRFDLGGLTFLPESGAKYENMPYVEITEQEYNKLLADFPPIKWELLEQFETTDETTAAQELACVSGVCELP